MMKIGFIGLGKMGAGMTTRLVEKGYEVVAYDPNPDTHAAAAAQNIHVAESMENLVAALPAPRTIWIMVPHTVVGRVIAEIVPFLREEDTIIDGGNSLYKDTLAHAQDLTTHRIDFVDVGVSGGPSGARHGACLMVGGTQTTYARLESLFADLAAPDAYGYMGDHGAGHFAKMVHNGIEYGMMQAIAEGFAVIKAAPFELDLAEIARVYNQQSVITSRLTQWLVDAYAAHGTDLATISGTVGHSGEGQWTVDAARELGVHVPVIADSLQFRKDSTDTPSYTGQVVSALRGQFGGHDVDKK
jgi:6-phosphogluconate dehydrogenase